MRVMGGFMGQRHRRLVAASCCIWLLIVVALVSGQDAPDVTESRRAADQGDTVAQFHLGVRYDLGWGAAREWRPARR